MNYELMLVVLLLGGVITFGVYLTITTVADKAFEKQKWDLRTKNTSITLPLRLQAYERMCLFLERISPNSLLLRLVPTAASALELQQIALHEIREEYNHNVAQQLYVSNPAWDQVTNAMNETVAAINQAASEVAPEAPPSELARKIFSQAMEKDAQPVAAALKVLKDEIRSLF